MENIEFGIKVDDGSERLSSFTIENNSNYIELYNWQRRAIKYFFDCDGKVIFSVSTGVGKTYCAIEIIKKVLEKDKDCKVLIVVPKNVILSGWYKELYQAGIGLPDIGIFYGNIKEVSKITITNMQSINKLNMRDFDFLIMDEIHNYGTKKTLEFVRHDFKYKLGLTATLKRMDGKHNEILEIFNYNIFEYSPKEALRDDVLNPFSFTNIGIVMDEKSKDKYDILTQELNVIFISGGGYERIIRMNKPLKLKMLAKMNERKQLINNYYKKFNIAAGICRKHKDEKIIIFNEYNSQTSALYWHLIETGVKACIIHSDISQEKREENLTKFKLGIYNVVLATRILDEGFDMPSINVGIILAGQSGARQTIQRLGRVLRKSKSNSKLYQVYCMDTVEETYGDKRAKLFNELSNNYNELMYDTGEFAI